MEINNKGLYILHDGDYVPYEIPQGKVILCGVPGAFTPGCTKRHLPGFAKNLDKLDAKVVFVAVNDPSVMHEWNVLHGHPDIDAVADPLAVFSKYIGKDVDFGDYMGIRCKRYAILLEDGVFVKEYEDPFVEGVLG
jgi:peroxiredoxin